MTDTFEEPVTWGFELKLDGLTKETATLVWKNFEPGADLTLTIPRRVWDEMGRPSDATMHVYKSLTDPFIQGDVTFRDTKLDRGSLTG